MVDQNKIITVGLSGGVDSAVSAYLLQQAGFSVNAIFMKNWQEESEPCPAALDFEDAKRVCERLQIDLQWVNFSDEYWGKVFQHFLHEYEAGRTPNPDILCNQEIKFKAFMDYAKNRGSQAIATGHYAQIKTIGNDVLLMKGNDENKDQSYFLYRLTQEQLKQSLFPVGHLSKPRVRQLAQQIGLKNHNKKDSTGICFIGERRFKAFLSQYLPARPGRIESLDGEILGSHDGLMYYTIGQRQGLNIGGRAGKLAAPWYVVGKDLKRNILQVVQSQDHPSLFKKEIRVRDLHWILSPPPSKATLKAKIRYRQKEQPCFLLELDEKEALVQFSEGQRAVTPGQSIVFYQDDICLGGGIIEN